MAAWTILLIICVRARQPRHALRIRRLPNSHPKLLARYIPDWGNLDLGRVHIEGRARKEDMLFTSL
jgi:hypothetical protein